MSTEDAKHSTYLGLKLQVPYRLELAERYPKLVHYTPTTPMGKVPHLTLVHLGMRITAKELAMALQGTISPGCIAPGIPAPVQVSILGYALWRTRHNLWYEVLLLEGSEVPYMLHKIRENLRAHLKELGIAKFTAERSWSGGYAYQPHLTLKRYDQEEQPRLSVPDLALPLEMTAYELWASGEDGEFIVF